MKLNELITKLEKLREDHGGNLEVVSVSRDFLHTEVDDAILCPSSKETRWEAKILIV